jgi:ribosomal protein L19E
MAPKHRKPYTSWDSDADAREPPEICPTTGKRKYASEAEAKSTAQHQMSQRVRAVLAARREQKESASLQLRTYRCLYCNAWHLTSKEA